MVSLAFAIAIAIVHRTEFPGLAMIVADYGMRLRGVLRPCPPCRPGDRRNDQASPVLASLELDGMNGPVAYQPQSFFFTLL